MSKTEIGTSGTEADEMYSKTGGWIPEIQVSGTVAEAGQELGQIWVESLRAQASARTDDNGPWWRHQPYKQVLERYAPHLPELYSNMAKGAGVPEDKLGARVPVADTSGGCTSFAIAPSATLAGEPISGQTKDGRVNKGRPFQVLALSFDDVPHSVLALTYPSEIFGFGLVTGGCSIFRNDLPVAQPKEGMPFDTWGLLARHCPSVDDVMRLTRDFGVGMSFHVVVADEAGGIVGIENGGAGTVFLEAENDIYVHGNAVVKDEALIETEKGREPFTRVDSVLRRQVLGHALAANRTRLTPQLCYAAMMNHIGYPTSLCRHQPGQATTNAIIIAEPTQRRVHVSRGPICQYWPRTHRL